MSRPLRILQCVSDIDPAWGGSVEAARQLSAGLAGRGHAPELLTLRPPEARWLSGWSGPVHYAGPAFTRYLYSPELTAWAGRHASAYDAVLIHGLWRYTSAGVRRALGAAGTPYFVFPHGMLDPYFRRAFPVKHLEKLACWLAAERHVIRDARAVLFTCEEERRRARATFPGYRSREQVVGLGIQAPPPPRPVLLSALFAPLAGKRVVLFLGRIHPKKGCDLLIRAFARVAPRDPSLHLVIAGPDECGWLAELRNLAERSGAAARILFPGPLYGESKWALLRAAEVFALPSHAENFGISVVEALACSAPVLLSRQVNIWREIEGDGAGLAAADDLPGTLSALERWLALSEAQRAAMRGRAGQCFSARYESSQFVTRVLEVIAPRRAAGGTPEHHAAA